VLFLYIRLGTTEVGHRVSLFTQDLAHWLVLYQEVAQHTSELALHVLTLFAYCGPQHRLWSQQ